MKIFKRKSLFLRKKETVEIKLTEFSSFAVKFRVCVLAVRLCAIRRFRKFRMINVVVVVQRFLCYGRVRGVSIAVDRHRSTLTTHLHDPRINRSDCGRTRCCNGRRSRLGQVLFRRRARGHFSGQTLAHLSDFLQLPHPIHGGLFQGAHKIITFITSLIIHPIIHCSRCLCTNFLLFLHFQFALDGTFGCRFAHRTRRLFTDRFVCAGGGGRGCRCRWSVYFALFTEIKLWDVFTFHFGAGHVQPEDFEQRKLGISYEL